MAILTSVGQVSWYHLITSFSPYPRLSSDPQNPFTEEKGTTLDESLGDQLGLEHSSTFWRLGQRRGNSLTTDFSYDLGEQRRPHRSASHHFKYFFAIIPNSMCFLTFKIGLSVEPLSKVIMRLKKRTCKQRSEQCQQLLIFLFYYLFSLYVSIHQLLIMMIWGEPGNLIESNLSVISSPSILHSNTPTREI